jgi:tetratricopeptide (TPR) repeat protein
MTTILSALLRIILYGTLAAAIIVGAHYFLEKEKTEVPVAVSQTRISEPSPAPVVTTPPVVTAPIPAPSTPAAHEIIGTVDESSALSKDAKESFVKGDYRKAADLCTKLAEKNKKAFLCVGLSYFRMSHYDKSIVFLEQALQGGAEEFPCRKYLAFSYYYRDNFEKSMLNAEKGEAIMRDAELDAFYSRLLREKKAKRNFVSESTNHFKVEYDGYEHGEISRKVIGMLEEAYSSIGSDLDYYPTEPVTVILYTNHTFYDTTQAPAWSGGTFDHRDGKIRVPVKGVEGQEALLKTVLSHEYVHALVHSITKKCPLWLNEGLAEYYAKGPSQKIGQIIPLNRLENSLAGLNGKGIVIAYIESRSAVSYLIDRYRPYRMKELLFSLSKDSNLNTAFNNSFQMSYTDFMEKWGRN